MKPIRLVIKTGTPVVLTEFAPSLDAIVFEALTQMTLLGRDEILERMKQFLKWNDELGVFHASAMRFVISPEIGVTRQVYVRTDSQRDLFLSKYILENNSAGNGYKRILTAGGPYKTRLNRRPAYGSHFVCFDAVGDGPTLKRLLENAFVGVGYDAFSAGMGEIKSVEILDLTEDISIQCGNEIRRNVPQTKFKLPGAIGRVCETPVLPPYYYAPMAQTCLAPERVAILSINQLANPN